MENIRDGMIKHNLIGRVFGHLTATEISGKTKDNRNLWSCICSCGSICHFDSRTLLTARRTSCGCIPTNREPNKLEGKRFGKLLIIDKVQKDTGRTEWNYKCDCGVYGQTTENQLMNDAINSCGCEQWQNQDLTGQKIGYLTVIKTDGFRGKNKAYLCKCDCGKECRCAGGDLSRGRKTNCGCKSSERMSEKAKERIGKNNANWKGGVTPINKKIAGKARNDAGVPNWRKEIYKRDCYTCQCCRKSKHKDGVQLNAHHIDNFKDFPEKRSDPDNGITLCEACHARFHTTYGFKNTNKSHIEDFLKTASAGV